MDNSGDLLGDDITIRMRYPNPMQESGNTRQSISIVPYPMHVLWYPRPVIILQSLIIDRVFFKKVI